MFVSLTKRRFFRMNGHTFRVCGVRDGRLILQDTLFTPMSYYFGSDRTTFLLGDLPIIY